MTKFIEEVLVSCLSSGSVVSYPNTKKELDDYCVVYQKVSDVGLRTMSKQIYLNKAHFLLSCYSATYSGVKTLANNVKNLVDMNTSNFNVSWITNDQDVIDPIESGLKRVDLDLYIFYNDMNLV